MFKRLLAALVILAVPALAMADKVAQGPQTPPTLVIRLASLDSFFENLKLLGGLLGQDDLGKNLDDALKGKLGAKGLYGIDSKRPIGLYATIGADLSDLTGVLMVPIPSDKQFKQMLDGMGWTVSADNTGLHTVKQDLLPIDLQYRTANGYAYVGLLGQKTLEPARLLSPKVVFGGKSSPAAISMTVRLGQLPPGIAGLFVEGLKDGLGKIDSKSTQSPAQKALRAALTNEIARLLESVLTDGDELNALIDIEPKTKQLSVDVTLTAKGRSKLTQAIAKLGQRQTLFAGVLHKGAAMNGLINFEVPAEVRSALNGVIQEAIDKTLADQDDAGKKKQTTDLINALKPSLTAEDIDVAFSMRGPNKSKQFTLVAGFKLKQGNQLAATLVELTKFLPAKDQAAIKLNADTAGGVAIHRLDLQAAFDANVKDIFGEHALFVAIRDDALFLAIGEDGLAAIKQALVAPARVAPPLQFDVSMARFAAITDKNAAGNIAKALLDAGDDARMWMTLEGGTALRLRFNTALSAFKLFGKDKPDDGK